MHHTHTHKYKAQLVGEREREREKHKYETDREREIWEARVRCDMMRCNDPNRPISGCSQLSVG